MSTNYKINFITESTKISCSNKRKHWTGVVIIIILLCVLNLTIAFGTNDLLNKSYFDPSDPSSTVTKSSSKPTLGDLADSVNDAANSILSGSILTGTNLSSDAADGFYINWYSWESGKYESKNRTHVHYVKDKDQDLDQHWDSLSQPFYSDDIDLEYCPNKDWLYKENNSASRLGLIPHFDVSKYEETYYIDGKAYAYSRAFLKVVHDNKSVEYVQVTKFAYNHIGSSGNTIYYINEFARDRFTDSKIVNIKNIDNVQDFEVYIGFWNVEDMHKEPKYQGSDFYATWENGDDTYDGDLRCRYCCYDSSYQSLTDIIYMDPPHAGDIGIPSGQRIICDRTESPEKSFSEDHLSIMQFTGRYAEAEDPQTHVQRPAAYSHCILFSGGDEGDLNNYYELNKIKYYCNDSDAYPHCWRFNARKLTKTDFKDYTIDKTTMSNPICYIVYDFNLIVDGVDSKKYGIKINSFNYDAYITNHEKDWFGSNSINYEQSLKFQSYNTITGANGGCSENWNSFHEGTGNICRGIVKSKLNSSGFPELKDKQISSYNTQLNYLFDTNNYNFKKNYTDLTGLFNKDVLENTGYYCFGSSDLKMTSTGTVLCEGHFAQLRKKPDSKNPSLSSLGDHSLRNNFVLFRNKNLCDSGQGDHERFFMPFDDYATPAANNDYHFGMTIETAFMMPEDGIVKPEKGATGPMAYHFNGDDDVWVFIDGVLMLDLGGIHAKNRGDINFNNSEIKVYNEKSETSVYKTYYMDDEYLNANKMNRVELDNSDSGWEKAVDPSTGSQLTHTDTYTGATVNTYRYADYSTHEFKMFYLERGGGASNCEVAFNLASMPEDTITIGKQINSNSANIYGENDDFNYKVQVSEYDEITGLYGDWHDYYDGTHDAKYDVYNIDDLENPIRENQYATDSIIKIKNNEAAVLYGYALKDKFKIGEGDPNGNNEIESRWEVNKAYIENLTESPSWSRADVIAGYEPGNWYGVEDAEAGLAQKKNIIFFQNTPRTADFRVKKEESNGLETEVLISSNGSYPDDPSYVDPSVYVGDYDLWLADGTMETGKHTDDGKIKFNDGDTIIIHDVQTGIKMNVEDLSENRGPSFGIDECSYNPTSWKPGQMSDSYPSVSAGVVYDVRKWVNTNIFSSKIPLIPYGVGSDRYGEVYLRENCNLEIGKTVTVHGYSYQEKYDTYTVSAKLYNNSDVYDSSTEYHAELTRGSTTTDFIAKIDNGIVKIKDGDVWKLPELKDEDRLTVYSIIPSVGTIKKITSSKAIETNLDKTYWKPTSVTNSEYAVEMTDVEDGYVLSKDATSINSTSTNAIIVNNDFNEIPTGFILDPNLLWLLIIAILLVLGGTFAYKLRKSTKITAANDGFVDSVIKDVTGPKSDVKSSIALDSVSRPSVRAKTAKKEDTFTFEEIVTNTETKNIELENKCDNNRVSIREYKKENSFHDKAQADLLFTKSSVDTSSWAKTQKEGNDSVQSSVDSCSKILKNLE